MPKPGTGERELGPESRFNRQYEQAADINAVVVMLVNNYNTFLRRIEYGGLTTGMQMKYHEEAAGGDVEGVLKKAQADAVFGQEDIELAVATIAAIRDCGVTIDDIEVARDLHERSFAQDEELDSADLDWFVGFAHKVDQVYDKLLAAGVDPELTER